MAWQAVLRSYLTAADSVSRTMHISHAAACRILLTARLRHGIGPFYFCLFSLDGHPPGKLSEYLTNFEFEPVQRRWNPKDMHALVRDKLKFQERCEAAGLPVPRAIAVLAHSGERNDVSAWLSTRLSSVDCTEYFFKHAGGAHGHGAFVVERLGAQYRFGDRAGGIEDLVRYALSMLPPDERYLIQPRLRTHPGLSPIMSSSGLGTVRIVTRLSGNDVQVITACLRITVGSNVTDNFSVGSAGNLTAPIDLDSGMLGAAVGSARRDWPEMLTVNRHPDTGAPFAGHVVPGWPAVTRLAQQAHQVIPELGVIGWDIAVTQQGPFLIEANHAWDINLLQVAHRRGMRSEMQAVMGPF